LESKSATSMLVCCEMVVLSESSQSTSNSHISSRSPGALGPEWLSVSRWRMMIASAPVGGGSGPSRSAGVGDWKLNPGSDPMATR
jgi:hypothetical protein